MLKRFAALFLTLLICAMPVFALAADVMIGSCAELKDAITAAESTSSSENPVVIKLTNSFEYDLSSVITVKGHVIIDGQGQYTLTRSSSYTGTFFSVASGSSLTLQNMTIDGNNNWTFDENKYLADLPIHEKFPAEENTYVQPESSAPMASAYMIKSSGGTILLKNVTVQNHCSTNNGIISVGAGSTVTLDQTTITHCANTNNSGLVVNASGADIKVTMNEGTVIDGNFVGGNHGVFKIYSGTEFTMNGGEITNTKGWNSNGVAVGIYHATFIMKGGVISNNSSIYGSSNARNAAVYLHENSLMTMSGGEIINNMGRARGGIDSSKDTAVLNISGGTVKNNISMVGNSTHDIGGTTVGFALSGGTYTQNVTKYVAEDYTAFQTHNDTWIVIPESMVYKIIYELDGGQMSDYPEQYATGYGFSIPDPTKDGFTFLGWTGAVGTEPVKGVTIDNPTTGDLTFIANWRDNSVPLETEVAPTSTPTPTPTATPAPTAEPNIPQTGDSTLIGMFLVLMVVSMIGIVFVVFQKRQQN